MGVKVEKKKIVFFQKKKIFVNKKSKEVKLSGLDSRGRTPLHIALECQQEKIALLYLKSGSLPFLDKSDDLGNIPLHHAAKLSQNALEVTKLLLVNLKSKGVDALNMNEETPLYYAIVSGNVSVVQFLIDCGANLKIKCQSAGLSYLHVATKERNLELIKILLPLMKADAFRVPDKTGKTAFEYCLSLDTKDEKNKQILNLFEKNWPKESPKKN